MNEAQLAKLESLEEVMDALEQIQAEHAFDEQEKKRRRVTADVSKKLAEEQT